MLLLLSFGRLERCRTPTHFVEIIVLLENMYFSRITKRGVLFK